MEGDLPAWLSALVKQTIGAKLYPPDTYPRQWFPELDSILYGLFQEEWNAQERMRQGFHAEDPHRAVALVEDMLGLPSLLANHAHAVVMIYRTLITGYIQRRHFRQEERDDILQELLSRFLADKIFRIQKKYDTHFSQMPSFTSYFMVCVRNMYMDIIREGKIVTRNREREYQIVQEMDAAGWDQILRKAILEEEYVKLRSILRLHPAGHAKIILCLKLKFRLPVAAADVRRCFPDCSAADIERLCLDYRTQKDRELFKAIVPVFNRHEPKPIRTDTLRKWIENKTAGIMALMNQMHQAQVYNRKNIADLLNLFFEEKDAHDQEK